MNKRVIIIFTFVSISAMGQGSGILMQGYVQDDFLERGLFDCTVTLMCDDSTMMGCSSTISTRVRRNRETWPCKLFANSFFHQDKSKQFANSPIGAL
jgi:hypothetical protein